MPARATPGSPPREWYRITCQADAGLAHVWVYDVIGADPWTGEGVSAKAFLAELAALPEAVRTLVVHINSPGGSVFDAVAIANTLRSQSTERKRTVEMRIEGLAASAASIKIASNAMLMIHNPSGVAQGESKDMRAMAEALDSIQGAMVATYRWVSPLAADAIQALMDATTWMSAEEALANGFVTEIMAPVAVEARFRPEALALLGEIPEAYRSQVEALLAPPTAGPPVPPDPVDPVAPAPTGEAAPIEAAASDEDVEVLCEREGFSLALTRSIKAERLPMTKVIARVNEAVAIRGLCAAATLPELADGYLRDRVSVASVQAHLTIITAKMHDAAIGTSLPADGGAAARVTTGKTAAEIYAHRRAVAAQARDGQKGV